MNADTATEQAQHKVANDAITDVDCNSVLAREQAGTYALAGKAFTQMQTRQQSMFDHFANVLAAAHTKAS